VKIAVSVCPKVQPGANSHVHQRRTSVNREALDDAIYKCGCQIITMVTMARMKTHVRTL
jgi:hypothetical protein